MKRRLWIVNLPFVLLTLALFLLTTPSSLPAGRDNAGDTLRIVTANLRYLNIRPQSSSLRLAGLDADVVIALEWTGDNLGLDALPHSIRLYITATGSGIKPNLDPWTAGVRSPVSNG